MKWNQEKSVILSRFCIILCGVCVIGCMCLFPFIAEGVVRRRGLDPVTGIRCFYATLYSLSIPALVALVSLYKLLNNIQNQQTFDEENVKYLRIISWACYVVSLIGLVSTVYYIPFIMVAAASGFMGLILRVVKNVFAEAVRLKQENDYTI